MPSPSCLRRRACAGCPCGRGGGSARARQGCAGLAAPARSLFPFRSRLARPGMFFCAGRLLSPAMQVVKGDGEGCPNRREPRGKGVIAGGGDVSRRRGVGRSCGLRPRARGRGVRAPVSAGCFGECSACRRLKEPPASTMLRALTASPAGDCLRPPFGDAAVLPAPLGGPRLGV